MRFILLVALISSTSLLANPNSDLTTALMSKFKGEATAKEALAAIDAAIAAGASIDGRVEGGGESIVTPVITAISFNFPEGLRRLIAHGAIVPYLHNGYPLRDFAAAMGFEALDLIPESAEAEAETVETATWTVVAAEPEAARTTARRAAVGRLAPRTARSGRPPRPPRRAERGAKTGGAGGFSIFERLLAGM